MIHPSIQIKMASILTAVLMAGSVSGQTIKRYQGPYDLLVAPELTLLPEDRLLAILGDHSILSPSQLLWLSASGEIEANFSYAGTSPLRLKSIAPSQYGHIFLTGDFSLTSRAKIISKLEPDGDPIWTRKLEWAGHNFDSFGIADHVSTNDGGALLAIYSSTDTISNNVRTSLHKLDSLGNIEWQLTLGGENPGMKLEPLALKGDGSDYYLVMRQFNEAVTYFSAMSVMKFSMNGELNWQQAFSVFASERFWDFEILGDGSSRILSSYFPSLAFVLSKISSEGNLEGSVPLIFAQEGLNFKPTSMIPAESGICFAGWYTEGDGNLHAACTSVFPADTVHILALDDGINYFPGGSRFEVLKTPSETILAGAGTSLVIGRISTGQENPCTRVNSIVQSYPVVSLPPTAEIPISSLTLSYADIELSQFSYDVGTESFCQVTGVAESPEVDSFKIFPNPSTDEQFNVEWEGKADVTSISVFDAMGRQVAILPILPFNDQQSFDLSHLSAGMYFLIPNHTAGAGQKLLIR